MKIVNVASEANPLAKSGGLGDVVYSLSRELAKAGHEVSIIIPFYKSVKGKCQDAEYIGYDYIDMSWRHQYLGIFKKVIDGVNYYLIDSEQYFGRDNLYGYDDDGERFAYFALAAQKVIAYLNLQPDIVHVHDWQAGMLPTLMRVRPIENHQPHYILTIHNPAFKGYLYPESLGDLYNLPIELFDNGSVRFEGMVSTLKAAIYFADKITTVSPTHRNELLTEEYSQGLCQVLEFRRDDFVGILNGVDVVEFDPEHDPKIKTNYSAKAFLKGKKDNKKDLLEGLGIKDIDAPTFGIVSRLTYQKGIDLVVQNALHLLYRGANIVVLGSGEYGLERAIQELRDARPDKVGVYIGYNDAFAHKVYAGCDFFLMPSLFEPCGIGQIVAQRYGTLPIARETGGLVDTVHPEVDGFTFQYYDVFSMRAVLDRALDVYYMDNNKMKEMIKTAMSLDRSWVESMNKYLALYKEVIR